MRLLALLLFLTTPLAAASDPRALELIRRIDDLWRGDASHAVMGMRVKTANYERSMRLEAWSQGTDRTLVRILSPAREKGTATLKDGDAIYTYLPRTDRTIKLNAGMMGGSWMGSHFTNDDLVREDRLSEDFDVSISFEGKREGRACVELTLDPKPEAAVVWGRIVTLIDAESLQPIRSTYFDEDLKPARTMSFHDLKRLGGRMVPSRMRLTPADKPNEHTEMLYESLELDPKLPANFFSLQGLKRR
jgi:outer membrane lipoprotein-sorting protein